jgi:ankyrin repeat protein
MACLKVCLNHHFNPNRYHREISLLHYAVESDNHDAITLLAKHNADLLILNANKQTPLTMAITLKRQNCIAALTKAIKKRCKKLLSIKNSNYSCGLTKHIFNDNTPLKFCKDCVETLMWQLDYHNLS